MSGSRRVATFAAAATLLATAACAAVLDIEAVPDPSDGGGATSDASGANDGSVGHADGSSGSDGGSSSDGGADGAPPSSDGGVGLDASNDADAAPDLAELISAPAGTTNFGTSIAFASNQPVLAVGAPGSQTAAGSVTMYLVKVTDGTPSATPVPSLHAPDAGTSAVSFGTSVAFGSPVGSTTYPLAVGAPTITGGTVVIESIDILSGALMAAPITIDAPPAAFEFGSSVAFDAVTGDLYVGAPGGLGGASGIVYVYTANTWARPSGGGGSVGVGTGADLFGASLAPQPGGGIIIGAPTGAAGDGTAYALLESGVKLPIPAGAGAPVTSGANSALGQAVAVSPAGSPLLLGAPDAGAAYLVGASMPPGGWGTQVTPVAAPSLSLAPTSLAFGRSVAMLGDQLAIGGSGFVAVYAAADTTQVHVEARKDASFGSSLAYTTLGGSDLLAVGAPVAAASAPTASGGSVYLIVSPTP